jgi:hypothetical protein
VIYWNGYERVLKEQEQGIDGIIGKPLEEMSALGLEVEDKHGGTSQ